MRLFASLKKKTFLFLFTEISNNFFLLYIFVIFRDILMFFAAMEKKRIKEQSFKLNWKESNFHFLDQYFFVDKIVYQKVVLWGWMSRQMLWLLFFVDYRRL